MENIQTKTHFAQIDEVEQFNESEQHIENVFLPPIEVLAMLGEGSQGRVCLCKFEGKPTQSISDLFVVKILQQDILKDEDPEVHITRLEHMSNELQILVIIRHFNFQD